MKTIRGRHKDSLVIVKIFVKPEQGLSLQRYVQRLEGMQQILIQSKRLGYHKFTSNTTFYHVRGAKGAGWYAQCVSMAADAGDRKGRLLSPTILLWQLVRSHQVNGLAAGEPLS